MELKTIKMNKSKIENSFTRLKTDVRKPMKSKLNDKRIKT